MDLLQAAPFGLCRRITKMERHVSTSWMWIVRIILHVCQNIINSMQSALIKPFDLCFRGSNNDLFVVEETGMWLRRVGM